MRTAQEFFPSTVVPKGFSLICEVDFHYLLQVGLEINPCTLADVGIYTCRLTNPLGSAEAAAQGNVRKVFTPAFFVQKFGDMQQVRRNLNHYWSRINYAYHLRLSGCRQLSLAFATVKQMHWF